MNTALENYFYILWWQPYQQKSEKAFWSVRRILSYFQSVSLVHKYTDFGQQ